MRAENTGDAGCLSPAWHIGMAWSHMPLGADGIQSKELFVRVAEKVGGVVLPMLFMGPDRVFYDRGTAFYGMDINTEAH